MPIPQVTMAAPVQRLSLGPLDHLPPRHYTRFAIYLPLKPNASYATAFAELQRGLHKTFLQLPWLNGKVFWQSKKTPGWRPGQLEVQYTPIAADGPAPWQFKYNELTSDVDIDELRETGFPTDTFTDQEVLWAPFAPDIRKGADVFIGQANFMPGACVLCAAIFHSVADGMADVTIFKLWADHTRGDEGGGASELVLPADSADRGAIERLWEEERSGTPFEKINTPAAWNIVGLEAPVAKTKSGRRGALANKSARWKHSIKKESGKVVLRLAIKVKGEAKAIDSLLAASTKEPELKSRMFYISPANFAALKRACAEGGQLVSGNHAVCALLWRSLMRARIAAEEAATGDVVDDGGDSRIEMTVDGRHHLSLPPTYLGNVVLLSRATLPRPVIAAPETTLSHVAQVLRTAGDSISPSSALDAYSLARGLEGYDRFDERATPVAGARMLVTSLLTMPASGIGFGDRGVFASEGRAEAIRPLMGAFNKYFRICFIMPPKSYGGIEVVFNLSDAEMEILLQDEEFDKYAMQMN
ncbi:hypothetical protein F5X68DRAFT_253324 [Plectosphaerella plurivora]|uniref:Trichothecene 3-O-acetyltransferase-like N-terminal domain-containing protein n=1 Tax=Plectosphaerella plurivora TaxID=936078 RepID=A0A9P8VEJ1_9PEZI|nr:hypothetical protein F5X68DRAFT_253324 [Plectosphaerella plurivora]